MANTTFHSLTLPGCEPALAPEVTEEFSSNTIYSVGDYCTYQGKLYKCTTIHSASAWNSAHFTEKNIVEVIDDKISAGTLPNDTLIPEAYKFNITSQYNMGWAENYFIGTSDGAWKGNSNYPYDYGAQGFLAVSNQSPAAVTMGDDAMQFRVYFYSSDSSSAYLGCTGFFDGSKTIVLNGKYNNYTYSHVRFVVQMADYSHSTAIYNSLVAAFTLLSSTDSSLSVIRAAADAKAVGDALATKASAEAAEITAQIAEGTAYTVDTGTTNWLLLRDCQELPIKKLTASASGTFAIRSKNIIVPPDVTIKQNGITKTTVLREDGSVDYISFTGTATSSYVKNLSSFRVKLGHKYYIYTGEGAISSSHRLTLGTSNGGGTFLYINTNWTSYTPTTDGQLIYINVAITNGTTVSDWRITPMVIVDGTVESYIPGYYRNISVESGEYDEEALGWMKLFPGDNMIYLVSNSAFADFQIEYYKNPTATIDDCVERIGQLEEEIEEFPAEELGEAIVDLRSEVGALRSFGANGRYAFRAHIPDYWIDTGSALYLSGKIQTINTLEKDAIFTFWTDSHWLWNAKKSMEIIGYVNAWCGIRKTFFGGDFMGNAESTDASQAQYLLHQHQDKVRDVFDRGWYYLLGDHDNNTGGGVSGLTTEERKARQLTFQNLYETCIQPWADNGQHFSDYSRAVEVDATEGHYWSMFRYYFDDDEEQIRYIFLNSGSPHHTLNDIDSDFRTSYNELFHQLGYLSSVLLSTPEGYGIVVMAHKFREESLFAPTVSIAKMLVAYKNRTTCTVQSGVSSSTTSTYDFTNGKGDVIMMLCGHRHGDYSGIWTGTDSTGAFTDNATEAGENDVLVINTTCDTRHNKSQMTLETTDEQAFDVFTIDKANRTIRTTRIGYGSNRVFTY